MISKHLLELTYIGVIQFLENCDFAHERTLRLCTVRLIPVRSHAPGLALLDHLDGEPLASGTRDGLHHGGKRAFAEFVADVIKCMYATLGGASGGVPIDEAWARRGSTYSHARDVSRRTVILDTSRLGCRGPKSNFISLFEDRGLIPADPDTVDLHTTRK